MLDLPHAPYPRGLFPAPPHQGESVLIKGAPLPARIRYFVVGRLQSPNSRAKQSQVGGDCSDQGVGPQPVDPGAIGSRPSLSLPPASPVGTNPNPLRPSATSSRGCGASAMPERKAEKLGAEECSRQWVAGAEAQRQEQPWGMGRVLPAGTEGAGARLAAEGPGSRPREACPAGPRSLGCLPI